MYQFRIQLQPRPSDCFPAGAVEIEGALWPTVTIHPSRRNNGGPTFDEALVALEQLPRMYVEPDGSFLWSGDAATRWQVDGNLYDRGDEIAYVEMNGRCPAEQFDDLLRCFGWPAVEFIFQLSREGVFVDEATFRLWAGRALK